MVKNNMKILFSLILIFQILNPIISIKEWWEETKIQLLNDNNFFDVVGKDKYVVVKFFTRWCMYCRMMSPEYEKFYELYLKKRDDVLIKKIECTFNQKICMEYGVFAFPFVVLFFPGSKKMKSVFKYNRIASDFDKWVSLVAPKKNLKANSKEELTEVDESINNNMTKIEDYISKQFIQVKKDLNNIVKHINKISDNGKKAFYVENDNNKGEEDDDSIIEIKITPFLIVKFILFFFLLKMVWYYIKSCLFAHSSLPSNLHQKN